MTQILTTQSPAGLHLTLGDLGLSARTGREDLVRRAADTPVEPDVFEFLGRHASGRVGARGVDIRHRLSIRARRHRRLR